jgi:A/G-specific adenine glycosylase
VNDFAVRLLAWFDDHGRHDLPWQSDVSRYSVWVSEIMLQQTQVSTVVPYFERFVARFPDVVSLADASIDEVLALWSGLGYYARGRNLHAASRIVRDDHRGELPNDLDALLGLPGIGRSTAGAILALASGQRQPILDGNVKRVLARVHAIEGWPGQAAVSKSLWELADRHTPTVRVAEYTQAIMDLGAMLCTRSKPRCEDCPLADLCVARAQDRATAFPGKRPHRHRPRRQVAMLIVRDSTGAVLVERRPASGIWGGLYSFPEVDDGAAAGEWCRDNLGSRANVVKPLESVAHSFTHFDLEIEPILIELDSVPTRLMDRDDQLWYNATGSSPLGMPAPVATLLKSLTRPQ